MSNMKNESSHLPDETHVWAPAAFVFIQALVAVLVCPASDQVFEVLVGDGEVAAEGLHHSRFLRQLHCAHEERLKRIALLGAP